MARNRTGGNTPSIALRAFRYKLPQATSSSASGVKLVEDRGKVAELIAALEKLPPERQEQFEA